MTTICRGSPHVHGIFWVKDSPDVSNLENASEEEVLKVIDYFSDLVEAWNPHVNADDADSHPCRKTYQEVENFEEDLAQLLQKVQRHTKCANDYCFKINKKTKKRECRFKFPKQMQEEATIERGDNNELEFKPKRNDPRLNKFNRFIIQLWRANIDIAPVISKRALLAYLAKYISKSEVQSETFTEVFRNVVNTINEDLKSKKAIHKVLMKSCAERDISAQEVCHTLLRLKLYSAGGRNFVTINMSDKKWLQVYDDEINRNCTNIIEKYQGRPDRLENVSMWHCLKKYNPYKWSAVKKNIVRVLPKLEKRSDDCNEPYYRQNVLLHVPWRNESDVKQDNETWEDVFVKYNIEEKIEQRILLKADLEKQEDSDYDSDESDSEDEFNHLTDKLLASRLGPKARIPDIDLGNRDVDTAFNWQETYKKYEQYGSIADFEGFIDKMKQETKTQRQSESLPNVQFSHDQQEIINLIKDQVTKIKDSQSLNFDKEHIKRIIIQGKAGEFSNNTS